ncbi:hypothetical protein Droror1_Dr00017138 [Drosera rotundifolia]
MSAHRQQHPISKQKPPQNIYFHVTQSFTDLTFSATSFPFLFLALEWPKQDVVSFCDLNTNSNSLLCSAHTFDSTMNSFEVVSQRENGGEDWKDRVEFEGNRIEIGFLGAE